VVADLIIFDWLSAFIDWYGLVVTRDFHSVHKLLGEDLAEKNEDEYKAILDFLGTYNWLKKYFAQNFFSEIHDLRK